MIKHLFLRQTAFFDGNFPATASDSSVSEVRENFSHWGKTLVAAYLTANAATTSTADVDDGGNKKKKTNHICFAKEKKKARKEKLQDLLSKPRNTEITDDHPRTNSARFLNG